MLFTSVFPHWHLYEYLCLAVSLSGTLVRIYTVGHTPVGTSGRNTANQVADVLNTTGIYSTVRHPLYLGNFLMWLGIALLTCNVGFVAVFVLAYWLYYERIMYAEEQFLRRKFGDTYLRWAERTPAFIPCLKRFRPTDLPFSWKKVIKKEKNGVFALSVQNCWTKRKGKGNIIPYLVIPNGRHGQSEPSHLSHRWEQMRVVGIRRVWPCRCLLVGGGLT